LTAMLTVIGNTEFTEIRSINLQINKINKLKAAGC